MISVIFHKNGKNGRGRVLAEMDRIMKDIDKITADWI
jgi:hypothetical protein